MSTGEIISNIITIISIIVTIYFGIGRYRAKAEVKRLMRFLDYKKMDDFGNRFRETLNAYNHRVCRSKWKENIQGRDIVGNIDAVLTEFNTYLPKINQNQRRIISHAIDEAKEELTKVRKGDEVARDQNLQHLNIIDRFLFEELDFQRKSFVDLL